MNIALNLPSVQQSPRHSQKRQELLKAYSPQRQIKLIIPQNQQQKQVNQQVQIQREARSDPLKAIQLSTGFGTHKILEMEAGIVSKGGKPLIMQMKEHSFSKVPQILQKPNYQPQNNTGEALKTQNSPKKQLENKFVDSLSVSPLKKSKRPAYKSIPAANIELPQLFPQNFEEENEYQNEENGFDEEQNVQNQFNPITGELNQQKVEFDNFNATVENKENQSQQLKENEFDNEFKEENKKQNQQKEPGDYFNAKTTEKKEDKQEPENEFDEFDEEHNGFDEEPIKQKYEQENKNKKNEKQNNDDEFDNSNNDEENEPKNDDFD
ncbi:Hypothetical_protein [Hexamita inflata]|uniref:Hypothetical_protein n=1 Tax=Hexamita inflata TaxID=28002 RepID=A0ABP1HIM9_9EUKA